MFQVGKVSYTQISYDIIVALVPSSYPTKPSAFMETVFIL